MTSREVEFSSWDALWRPALILIVASLVIHTVLVLFVAPALLTGDLIDTDAYMRLVRVRELATGGSWYDSVIDRNNWPYGDELHWTRPFDVLILLGAWLLTPFMGFTKGLYWAGALVSPMLQIVTSIALAWAAAPLVGKRLLALVMIAVLAQPAFMGYALAGRPDHHTFLLLLVVLQLGSLTRLVCWARDSAAVSRWSLVTGVLAAAGLWVSTELLLPLAVLLAVAGAAWIVNGGLWLNANRVLTRGLFIGVGAALLLERPLTQIGNAEYDRISVVHVVLAATLWTVWLAIGRVMPRNPEAKLSTRAVACTAGGVATALVMWALFPAFFRGPLAEMDPRVYAVWLDRVTEMEPLWPADLWEFGRLVAYLGPALVAPILAIVWIARSKGERWAWTAWALTAGAYATLSLWSNVRFAGGAEVLAIPMVIIWLRPAFTWIEKRRTELAQVALRTATTTGILAGPIFAGGFIMGLGKADEPQLMGMVSCDIQALSAWMTGSEGPGPEPRTVLTFLDFGPELLYRTNHRVLAGPYHRNVNGIVDIHDAFTTPDVERREDLLAEREVGWILICPARDQGVFYQPGSLYASLIEGPGPTIKPIALPADLAEEFKLFAVEPTRLTASGR